MSLSSLPGQHRGLPTKRAPSGVSPQLLWEQRPGLGHPCLFVPETAPGKATGTYWLFEKDVGSSQRRAL